MNDNNVFGLIYTGESNMQLRDLTYSRSVAAVPFGGRYRCVDFVMSCLVNSGIHNVGLIVQRNYHSLIDHVGGGKEWDLDRKRDGLFLIPPFLTRSNTGIYKGTVEALYAALGFIRRSTQRYLLLTGSHTIYNTTYDDMIKRHIETGADITIMYNQEQSFTPGDRYDDLRIVTAPDGRITDLMIDPYAPPTQNRGCDAFLMEKTLLEYLIEEAMTRSETDFTRDILIKKVSSLKMYGYEYKGYVARLDSLNAYYKYNLELLTEKVRSDLFAPEKPVYTKVKDEVSAKYGEEAVVKNSMIADGCMIEGTVENSMLFRGVRVEKGARIKNSIILQACTIGEGTQLDCVVLDKSVTVKRGRQLCGYDGCPIVIRKGQQI